MIDLGEVILIQRESSDSELSLRSYEFLKLYDGVFTRVNVGLVLS